MKIQVRKITYLIDMTFGLMFRTSKTLPVLFEFDTSRKINIHSWFVFFPFVALFLDKDNRIVERKIIMPFTSYDSKQKARKLLEIPLVGSYKSLLSI